MLTLTCWKIRVGSLTRITLNPSVNGIRAEAMINMTGPSALYAA